MANSTIKNPNAVISNTTIAGARCYKTGRVVYLIIDKNNVTANVDDTIATIPEGYRPIYPISFRESLHNYRLSVSSDNGLTALEPISGEHIRGGITYICE